MNTKIMEGLVGARQNMDLLNTPFRVYKEAERKGNTEMMSRAMGYVNEFSNKIDEYKAEADKGMKEEAKAAREKQKSECEEVIQKHREEYKKLEEKIEENRNKNKERDTINISEEGKVLLKENSTADSRDMDNIDLNDDIFSKANQTSIIYTKNGEPSQPEQSTSICISV